MKTLDLTFNIDRVIGFISVLGGIFFFAGGCFVALGIWEPTLNNVATTAFFGFSVALNAFGAARKK